MQIYIVSYEDQRISSLFLSQEGTSPLILSAANNHLEIVKELLANNASVNTRRKVSENLDFFLVPSKKYHLKLHQQKV